jgi:hypothetical protein
VFPSLDAMAHLVKPRSSVDSTRDRAEHEIDRIVSGYAKNEGITPNAHQAVPK